VDGNWGGLVDAEKNTFNGMIGMLQRKVTTLHLKFIFCLIPWNGWKGSSKDNNSFQVLFLF
jgi:hypothetical protein